MPSTLRGRFLKGSGSNVFVTTQVAVIQLVSVPLLLHFWGKELFGEWLVLSAVPMYLVLSSIDVIVGGGNEMTMLVATGRRREALGVFQSVWALTLSLSVLLGIVTFLLLGLGLGGYLKE